MDFARFTRSLAEERPPEGLAHALQALWWDIKGDWGEAHRCAQAQEDAAGAWVHAYLHRREGDASNAGYWYRRAGKQAASGPLDAERDAIIRALLGEG
jgi:hypothetical protein